MDNQKAIEWIRAISATQSDSIHKNSLSKRKETLHLAISDLKSKYRRNLLRTEMEKGKCG